MFEILANGAEYSAVAILCVTSWFAGRESRLLDRVLKRMPAPVIAAPEAVAGQSSSPAAELPQPTSAPRCSAGTDHDGDPEKAGIMEMLVSLADQRSEKKISTPKVDWRRSSAQADARAIAERERAEKLASREAEEDVVEDALILRRQPNSGALPLGSDELLSPDVLARYSNYAGEYAPAELTQRLSVASR